MEQALLVSVAFILHMNYGMCYTQGSDEPVCSKFHFEEKVLEKLVRAEHQLELQTKSMAAWDQKMTEKLKSIQSAEKELKVAKEGLEAKLLEYEERMRELVNETQSEVRYAATLITDEATETLNDIVKGGERPTVAFKARQLDKSSLSSKGIIRYKTEVLNVGGAYDKNTGYFTAPVDGTYLFIVQICTQQRKWFNVFIMANNIQVGTASYREDSASGSCSSGDALAVLKKGETAWIKNHSSATSSTVYEDQSDWNSFSGVLISV